MSETFKQKIYFFPIIFYKILKINFKIKQNFFKNFYF